MTTAKHHETPQHRSSSWDDLPEKKPAEGEPATPKMVRVRCVSHLNPWTDKKMLEFGEEAEVSEEIAKVLLERGFVEKAEKHAKA